MSVYRRGICHCPECGGHFFDGPMKTIEHHSELICHDCHCVTTVVEAESFGKTYAERKRRGRKRAIVPKIR